MTRPVFTLRRRAAVLAAFVIMLSGVGLGTAFFAARAAEPPTQLAERWAASPLIVPSRLVAEASGADIIHRLGEPSPVPAALVAVAMTALLGMTLIESLFYAVFQMVVARRPALAAAVRAPSRLPSGTDYEARCRKHYQAITQQWQRAETAVFDLDEAMPLRMLLFKEMNQISQRLALDPSQRLGGAEAGAVAARHDLAYWRSLSQRLNQSSRDLNRIGAVAEAAGAGFGGRTSEPRIPKTRDEACFILGANREAEPETLQRLVKALRQCWHPDLAQTDADRRHREARIKQINAAHDLITGKREEG